MALERSLLLPLLPRRPVRVLGAILSLLSLLAAAAPAAAATRTWQGGGPNDLWSTPANWVGGIVPVDGDLVVVAATALTGAATNDIVALSLAGLQIDRDFLLSGDTIELGAEGLRISPLPPATSAVLGLGIQLTADQTWLIGDSDAQIDSLIALMGRTLTFDIPGSAGDVVVTGAISATGGLVKIGEGLLRLTGNSTFAGPVAVNEGYLRVAHANGLGVADGTAANGTSVNGSDDGLIGASFGIENADVANEAVVIKGIGQSNNGALQAVGPASIAGPITLASDISVNVIAPSYLRFDGPIGGPGRMRLAHDGTFVFANSGNTFAGGLGIGEDGVKQSKVVIAADNAIPFAPVQELPVDTMLIMEGTTQTLGAVTGLGSIQVFPAQSELVLSGSEQAAFDGPLIGPGAVRYNGTGSQRFTSAAALTGTIVVDRGTVIVAAPTMPGTLIAHPTGRLVVTGAPTIGRIVVDDGALHLAADPPDAPSASAAVVTVSIAFAMAPAGVLTVDGTASGQLGRLNVSGDVSLGGTLTVALPATGFNAPVGSMFTLIENGGGDAVTGTFAGLPEGATIETASGMFRISYVGGDGNDVVLTLTNVFRDYLLSEGAKGEFFLTEILVANPNEAPAPIRLTFLAPGGGTTVIEDEVPAMARKTIVANAVASLAAAEFSTVVRSLSGLPLAVERTMTWDAEQPRGAHTERAADAASLRWYFAEGAQGFFSTYLLLANPGAVESMATVDYLIEGAPAVARTYAVPPLSRLTIDAGADAALVNRSFGMVVTFTQPGLAERAMYFGSNPLWQGGHASAGATAPSLSSFVAEGATGPFFETFILLANPNAETVIANLTFCRQGAAPIQKTRAIPAHSRLTLNLEQLDPGLANTPVSTSVDASQPLVVERAQYWPDPAPQWYEAHSSPAITALATTWALAEGRVGGPAEHQTYILLANPNDVAAQVSITFLRENGAPVTKTFTVPATERFNVPVGPGTAVPEIADERFGALVASDQPIAVERAMYFNANGQVWAAGTSANATPLP